MEQKALKKTIDELVNQFVSRLEKTLHNSLESITLTGTYVTGDISYERPNVNVLLFFKPEVTADSYITLGKTLFELGERYTKEFSLRIDLWPHRFSYPIGEKCPELSLFVQPLNVSNKDLTEWITPDRELRTPFGISLPVILGFKAMRKVVFGKDILGEIDADLSLRDIVLSVLRELPLFRIQLIKAPLTYDVEKRFDLLATESIEAGKACLYFAVEIGLSNEQIKTGQYIEFFRDKQKLLRYIREQYPIIAQEAKTILDARDNFLAVRKDKQKSFEVYKAAYTILNQTFFTALKKLEEVD